MSQPFVWETHCGWRTNTASCTYLVSLKKLASLRARWTSRHYKAYWLLPGSYILIKWSYWNKRNPPYQVEIYKARITSSKDVYPPKIGDGEVVVYYERPEHVEAPDFIKSLVVKIHQRPVELAPDLTTEEVEKLVKYLDEGGKKVFYDAVGE